MDPWSLYITHSELPPPVVVPRRKKRLKQLQLQLELELEQDNVWYCFYCVSKFAVLNYATKIVFACVLF